MRIAASSMIGHLDLLLGLETNGGTSWKIRSIFDIFLVRSLCYPPVMLGLPTWSQGYAAKIMSLVRFSGVYKTRNSKLWKAEIEARSISIVSIVSIVYPQVGSNISKKKGW